MFRRTWWTRRRVWWSGLAFVVLVAVIVWVSGTEELYVGQPLDEAKAALWRAGATDQTKNCGMLCSVPLGKTTEIDGSYWELPDGRTVYLVASRESPDEPFRVARMPRWQGWYKNADRETVELPPADSVRFRRSVLAFVPVRLW